MHQSSAIIEPMDCMQGRANRLLDNIYTAVLVFDRKLQLTDINTAGENLLSISHRKMCGHYADEILTTPHKLVENIRRALKTRQPYMEWGNRFIATEWKSDDGGLYADPVDGWGKLQ